MKRAPLSITHPDLAEQANGWDPTTVTAGTPKRLSWKCDKGHTWVTRVSHRTEGQGCPYCLNMKVLIGYNDLATTHPELALQANGWDSTAIGSGSSKKLSWKCDKGHTWVTRVSHRTEGQGCPSCSVSGYDPNKKGYLYFLSHDQWGLYQIGISNVPKDRIATHSKAGWNVIEIRGPIGGYEAFEWEQAILKALKKLGVELGPAHIAGRFSGYTEAWIQEDFSVGTLAELMKIVHPDEA